MKFASLLLFCGILLVALPCRADTVADKTTTRIISLVPALTEIAFTIGAGSQVVGVSTYCEFPPEAKTRPRVGGLLNPSLEPVLLLRPDAVLLYRSQADFAAKLAGLGTETQLFDLDRLEHVYAACSAVGEIAGRTAEASRLEQEMREAFSSMRRKHNGVKPVTALLLVSRDPAQLQHMYQAGPANFLGELLAIAGGTHAVPGGAAVTREQVIRGNPEVIIDLSGAEKDPAGQAEDVAVSLWSQLSTVDAVRNGRVHYLVDRHALVPGPYLPTFARKLETLLH